MREFVRELKLTANSQRLNTMVENIEISVNTTLSCHTNYFENSAAFVVAKISVKIEPWRKEHILVEIEQRSILIPRCIGFHWMNITCSSSIHFFNTFPPSPEHCVNFCLWRIVYKRTNERTNKISMYLHSFVEFICSFFRIYGQIIERRRHSLSKFCVHFFILRHHFR